MVVLTTLLDAQKTSTFDQALNEAEEVSNQLAERVRSLLLKEIKKGGFSSAVRACSETAQKINQKFTIQTGNYIA